MRAGEFSWSKTEKKIARKAFDTAYKREMAQIRKEISEKFGNLKEPKDVWELHDYLSEKREEIDTKYDYRYSVLIWVFSRLWAEGFLSENDLSGLSPDKIATIKQRAKCWP